MKCCICGHSITRWGNNPYPLCSKNDYDSRCCDLCNSLVVKARLIDSRKDNKNIQVGDTLIILYSKQSDAPTQILAEQRKFLVGTVNSILKSDDQKSTKYEGSWGGFIIDSQTDSFAKVS